MTNKVINDFGVQVPVRYWRSTDGLVHAEAPDLPGCTVVSPRLEEVLPMLRLAVESRIAGRIAQGQGVPVFRRLQDCASAEGDWAEIHIHTGHLNALVRHQSR